MAKSFIAVIIWASSLFSSLAVTLSLVNLFPPVGPRLIGLIVAIIISIITSVKVTVWSVRHFKLNK
jgi:hypothetical protein